MVITHNKKIPTTHQTPSLQFELYSVQTGYVQVEYCCKCILFHLHNPQTIVCLNKSFSNNHQKQILITIVSACCIFDIFYFEFYDNLYKILPFVFIRISFSIAFSIIKKKFNTSLNTTDSFESFQYHVNDYIAYCTTCICA